MSKVTKPKEDEATMQIPESKWNESQKLLEKKDKKIDELLQKLQEKEAFIQDLQKAVEITQFSKASDLKDGDRVELKMAREAYKSFSFVYEDGMWKFEFMVDPMVKKCHLLSYKRLR